MTNQELYDTVVQRMNAQGGPSRYALGCRYRNPQGRKCAVGCLIDDKYYEKCLEGYPVTHPTVRLAVTLSIGELTEDQWALLDKLQQLHDNSWTEGKPFPEYPGDRLRFGIE